MRERQEIIENVKYWLIMNLIICLVYGWFFIVNSVPLKPGQHINLALKIFIETGPFLVASGIAIAYTKWVKDAHSKSPSIPFLIVAQSIIWFLLIIC
ncbi:hypothetical protein PBV87_18660 [Niameybacter massiliensis]|uniref:Uncharacterized protein n=1 Tax=Holtiella tumoricola TaxID=3018743 RepID=A0AA42DR34_9FIRM|nr:hypothetical protein [Holtiella tumoricola]MDA3733506.1 hypothetical protein [Holtiella tumoricola]